MKSVFVMLAFVSLIGVAVFGFVTMDHEGSGGHGGCIAATASGGDCPAVSSGLGFAFFHLNAFKGFSLGLALVALALALPFLLAHNLVFLFSPFRINRTPEVFAFSSSRNFSHWLALHENSPSRL